MQAVEEFRLGEPSNLAISDAGKCSVQRVYKTAVQPVTGALKQNRAKIYIKY